MYKGKHTYITYAILGVLLTLVTSSCDTSEPEPINYSGRWSTTSILNAEAGRCCDMDVTITETNGKITGSGTIERPYNSGNTLTFPIKIAGTITSDRMTFNISSDTGENKGSFGGTYREGTSTFYDFEYTGTMSYETQSGSVGLYLRD